MGSKKIVAVLPAFNEQRTIAEVVLKTERYVNEVVVVDDGSTDMTGEIAERLGATVLRHEKNMGKGAALKTGFEYAVRLSPDVVVTLDTDAQHDPDEIPKLIEPIIEEYVDLVIGSRYMKESKADLPLYRRLGLRLIDQLSRKSSKGIVGDTQSGFRALSAKGLDVVLRCEASNYGLETEQLAMAVKGGLRVVEVPITAKYMGLEKTSKRSPVRHGAELVGTTLRLIVEERPLLLLGVPGMVLVISGIATGIYLIWYFNLTRYFSIPLALITIGTLFVGTLLFVTSLIFYAITRLKQKN